MRSPRPGGTLTASVGYSGLAQALTMGINIALAPYLIRHLGLDRFGVWSLILSLLVTFADLDGGVGASLARFFALHGARNDRRGAARLLLASLLLFIALGLLVTATGWLLAPTAVGLLSVPEQLREEAITVLSLLGPLVSLALVSNSATSLLQANSRFRGLAGVTACSCLSYVAAVVLAVESGGGLSGLLIATAVRYLVLIVGGLWLARRHIEVGRPLLPDRPMLREFQAYAVRMQLSGLTNFLNGGVDALVVAALLPIRYVAIYAVGLQAAAAFRSLPLYAFPPVLTRITTSFAVGGLAGAEQDFRRLQSRWLPGALAYGAVTATAVPFLVVAWVGPRFLLSGLVATILLLGYAIHVALTAVRTCFVRAIGRPGLETRYSWFATVLNLALTALLAWLFGLIGVVAGTALGLVGGSVYFVVICQRAADLPEQRLRPRWYLGTGIAVVVTLGCELAVHRVGGQGPLPLLLSALPVLLGLGLAGAVLFARPGSTGMYPAAVAEPAPTSAESACPPV
jgi:O-antigen/teichoic acid export membrane protein